jgi:ribosomal protein S18 acetylase RimI-like enzyme
VEFREATERDIAAIVALHAESWRRNYRGAYSDEFLDGEVFEDRRAVWTERLTHPKRLDHTVVAEDGGVIAGFVHTILDHDPVWGALLDNLHVTQEHQRRGLGTQLMTRSAEAIVSRAERAGLYLWVLESNRAAQAFYRAQGGRCVDREISEPPGGGRVVGLRYVWRDPSVLLDAP